MTQVSAQPYHIARLFILGMGLFVCSCTSQQSQALSDCTTPSYLYVEGTTPRMLSNGKVTIPKDAPPRIKRAIAAANKICGKPYRMGGGHGKHDDYSYDCSGSIAFILREAGMLQPNRFLTSGEFLRWGRPGFGDWMTVYTKKGHVFVMLAGLRFDATGTGSGPRWYSTSRPCNGFYVRHVPGF